MRHSADPITRRDLDKVFIKSDGSTERMGLEVEIAAVDPVTGDSCHYEGPNGVRTLLQTVQQRHEWRPTYQDGHLVALTRDDDTQITLEPGGAVEYGSSPTSATATLLEKTRTDLQMLADCAARLNIALMPGANYPFNDISTVKWTPKRHSEIVREYLAGLGVDGEWGPQVMALTLSTQVTLDYTDGADLIRKLRTQVAASPIVSALFVNSPLEAGRLTGLLSQRMRYWTRHDPRRTGVLEVALRDGFTAADFVDWAAGLPMIYRRNSRDEYASAHNRPFTEILAHGFEDGSRPTLQDWLLHLSQIWTDVRLRQTLELRAADGPPYSHLGTVPAFWVGLTYDASTCEDAWELLREYRAADYRLLMDDVARRGTHAELRGTKVLELATELLRLARQGMTARIEQGLEDDSVLACLEPLDEVAATGTTFAERCINRWRTEFHESPRKYVQAFRIPVD